VIGFSLAGHASSRLRGGRISVFCRRAALHVNCAISRGEPPARPAPGAALPAPIHRRDNRMNVLLRTGCLLVPLCVAATAAPAQDAYPTKPVRLVVGFTAGGPTDVP